MPNTKRLIKAPTKDKSVPMRPARFGPPRMVPRSFHAPEPMGDTCRRALRDHEIVLALYKRANEFADLLYAAGNYEKSEEVRAEAKLYASESVSSRILKS